MITTGGRMKKEEKAANRRLRDKEGRRLTISCK